jgi:tetratricopeptide (TPR) repeat protein
MSDGVPADAQIISDDVLGEEGQSEAIEEGQSADANPATFRLAGYRKAGDEAFRNGLDSSRMGAMNEALSAFQRAAQADPQNALYHYHQALTLYDMSGADAARDTLRQAVRAEQRAPIKDWGKRMERVQGPARLWVEKARRDAGLSR